MTSVPKNLKLLKPRAFDLANPTENFAQGLLDLIKQTGFQIVVVYQICYSAGEFSSTTLGYTTPDNLFLVGTLWGDYPSLFGQPHLALMANGCPECVYLMTDTGQWSPLPSYLTTSPEAHMRPYVREINNKMKAKPIQGHLFGLKLGVMEYHPTLPAHLTPQQALATLQKVTGRKVLLVGESMGCYRDLPWYPENPVNYFLRSSRDNTSLGDSNSLTPFDIWCLRLRYDGLMGNRTIRLVGDVKARFLFEALPHEVDGDPWSHSADISYALKSIGLRGDTENKYVERAYNHQKGDDFGVKGKRERKKNGEVFRVIWNTSTPFYNPQVRKDSWTRETLRDRGADRIVMAPPGWYPESFNPHQYLYDHAMSLPSLWVASPETCSNCRGLRGENTMLDLGDRHRNGITICVQCFPEVAKQWIAGLFLSSLPQG